MKKLYIEYTPQGVAIPDFCMDLQVALVISDFNAAEYWCNFEVSTGLFIDAMRLAIKQGRISHEAVVFVYKGQHILVDKHGTLDAWPEGFNDTLNNYLNGLLGI